MADRPDRDPHKFEPTTKAPPWKPGEDQDPDEQGGTGGRRPKPKPS